MSEWKKAGARSLWFGIDAANIIEAFTDTLTSADVNQSGSERRSLALVWTGACRRVAVSTDVSAVMERRLTMEFIRVDISCMWEMGGRAKRIERETKRNEMERNVPDVKEPAVDVYHG